VHLAEWWAPLVFTVETRNDGNHGQHLTSSRSSSSRSEDSLPSFAGSETAMQMTSPFENRITCMIMFAWTLWVIFWAMFAYRRNHSDKIIVVDNTLIMSRDAPFSKSRNWQRLDRIDFESSNIVWSHKFRSNLIGNGWTAEIRVSSDDEGRGIRLLRRWNMVSFVDFAFLMGAWIEPGEISDRKWFSAIRKCFRSTWFLRAIRLRIMNPNPFMQIIFHLFFACTAFSANLSNLTIYEFNSISIFQTDSRLPKSTVTK
jgi:hypothetical protein